MIALWIAYGLLVIGFVVILTRLLLLKSDIRMLWRKLTQITKTDTNSHLSTATFDKDLTALVQSINLMLETSRNDHRDAKRLEADLKRAITNISHDLRTPLTSAKGYLQMLETGQLDEETATRYLEVIRGRLDALTVLMDSLFAFSRAVEGRISLARVNVGNTLRDIFSGSFAEIEGKGFYVEVSIPDTPVYCLCDKEALSRVLQNLVENAISHGRELIRVKMSDNVAVPTTPTCVIEIANKADGLNLLDIDDIFSRFYTADAARTNKRTGLGLAIARELLVKMGGSISAAKTEDLFVVYITLPVHHNHSFTVV